MTQETKAKDCCYGVRPLSDCQCEKDRLAALAAEPSPLECQSEIDKDLVRSYYGNLGAFYRVRAALAATPIDALAHSEANCRGLRQRAEAAETKLAALAAAPAVGGEREALADKLEKMHWEAGAYPISCAELELCINALRAAPPASPLRGITDEMVSLACEVYAEVYHDDDKDMGDAMRAALKAAFSASPPEQPAAFQPHENCNCLMCLAERTR